MGGSAAEADQAWCIVGRGAELTVGPARSLGGRSDVRARVTLGEPCTRDQLGPTTRTIPVAESGVREFVVSWHDRGSGETVAVNPAGGNQVGWTSETFDAWWFSSGHDALQTSVYQRFVLRHLTTALLERDLDGRSIHAVTASWDGGVLAVAGPTRSGKTRLMNHLAATGAVGAFVDDDCPILTDGATVTLVPRRYEVERATVHDLRGLIILSHDTRDPRGISPARAHDLLETTPVPWPARWLPAEDRPPLPPLPPDLRILEVPAQTEEGFTAITASVLDGLTTPS